MFSEKELAQLRHLVDGAIETKDNIDGFSDSEMKALHDKLTEMYVAEKRHREFYASLKMPLPEDCDHKASRTEVHGGGFSCGKCGGFAPPL